MLEQLNQALDHIEEHLVTELHGDLDPAELARIATTSEHHFRRMFSALAGMPLSEYVRRRRLTVAGAEVLAGERTLLEIAVRHGYGSGEAFARAFRAVHGVGPGEVRRTGAALNAQPRMSFRLVVEGNNSMKYRTVAKDAFRIVGSRARVPLVYEGENPAIAAQIRGLGQETLDRLAGLSTGAPAGLVSAVVHLTCDREEGAELDHWYGVTGAPDAAPEGFETLDLPAGTWAVFENEGPYPQALQYLWRDVFTLWFPSNPYESRPGPEILSVRPSADWTTAAAELWIPVEHTAG
ncbi:MULTISPECIES: AraC family transcriptional regulator [unclassified Streptomyces]|uniref:AraC family transcriptional regulator n=1 Tax=unclassified Streptomyces TaxID=2593676 RepID=UPI001E5DB4E3|nr:AraC family transcriptional regulator [Streptomyces sp. CB02980]MCB8907733.1 AraC family transcriptional regulator [Streptomyces sp. CB02980]